MKLSEFEQARIKILMGSFLAERRPPPEMREKVDLDYRIEKQSVVIFEIRALWNDPDEKIEEPVAKVTYMKNKNSWKVYWQRADLKWHSYDPAPIVDTFDEFLKLVNEDECACFWG